jgi:replicative DNA helicase
MHPHDADAERMVLGAILLGGEISPDSSDAMAMLSESSWFVPAHRIVFSAMRSIEDSGGVIDELTVRDHIKSRNLSESVSLEFLMGITASCPTGANVMHHASIVDSCHVRRQVISNAELIREDAMTGDDSASAIVDKAAMAFVNLSSGNQKNDPVHVSKIIASEIRDLEKRQSGESSGLSTGFCDLDQIIGGLSDDDLMIIAARPAMGKSALALNIAQNVSIRGGIGVCVFNLEMSAGQLVQRVMCSEGRVGAHGMKTGSIRDSEWPKLAHVVSVAHNAPLWIDDSSNISVMDIRAKCRRLKMGGNLGLVVVDYIQLMEGSSRGGSRERDIAEITRGLKNLGKDLGVPVIAISQLNRGVESRTDKRPMLSDLRESGAIEQDASIVMFVYRDEYYNEDSPDAGIAELIIAKHRTGTVGTVKLRWDKRCTRFDSLHGGNTDNGHNG